MEGVINRADFNKQDELPQDRLIRLIEHPSIKKVLYSSCGAVI
jgi:hypothetical protein